MRNHEQIPDRLAARFFEGLSGHLFAGAIEAYDPPFAIEHNHQSAHGVENPGNDIALFLQLLFGLLEIGDVEANSVDEPGLPSGRRIILASHWNQITRPSRAITR